MKLSAAVLKALIDAATECGAEHVHVVIEPGDRHIYLRSFFAADAEGNRPTYTLPIAFEGAGPNVYPPQMIQRHVMAKITMAALDAGQNVGIAKGLL